MKTNFDTERRPAPCFLARFSEQIQGVLAGFDRLRFRGTLAKLYCPTVMEAYLNSQRVLLKDFGQYVDRVSASVRAATRAFAETWQRPVSFLCSNQQSKEELARKIARRDGIEAGLIAVFGAVEPCQSYHCVKNPQSGLLELRLGLRKCRHDYFYF